MPDLTEYGLNVRFPGVGALFDRHLLTANLALDDVYKRAVVRSLRALDQADGGKRCNRLPCDWRGAIIATGVTHA